MWDRIRTAVKSALAEAQTTDHVFVTGHSLGGALATLAALDLSTQMGVRVTMVNFGSPRVGNYEFAKLYDKIVPDSYRVVCDGDVVTGVPKLLFMYTHVGHEVVIDTQGNMIIDPTFVEKVFRTASRSKLSSHMMASYQTCLEAVLAAQGVHIDSTAKIGTNKSSNITVYNNNGGGSSNGGGSNSGGNNQNGSGSNGGEKVTLQPRDPFLLKSSMPLPIPAW